MSSFDRFRAPGDLASFFRSLVTPVQRYNSSQGYGSSASSSSAFADYEWESLRARQVAGTKHLDFFDHSLSGVRGAEIVLQALQESPGAVSISLVSRRELCRCPRADTDFPTEPE